ncbi:MAG: hypothetical protein COB93_06570 [Sneathiella sp.]|nr:MAG: hypothetical protein COB93_06570 [Sneathiella sp.]
MRHIYRFTGFMLLAVVALTGCEGTKQILGLNKEGPDEFTVLTKAPLIIPPDFSLRPPTPGQQGPQDRLANNRAKAALLGKQSINQTPVTVAEAQALGMSAGELALLRDAGAENVNPDIRQLVNTETIILAENDETFMERIMFWQEQPLFGTVVNPAQEKKRLQENAALGDTPADGAATPTIERRKRALLEGLFN